VKVGDDVQTQIDGLGLCTDTLPAEHMLEEREIKWVEAKGAT